MWLILSWYEGYEVLLDSPLQNKTVKHVATKHSGRCRQRVWSCLVLSPLRWRPSCQSLRGRPRSRSCWSEWCSDGPRDAGHISAPHRHVPIWQTKEWRNMSIWNGGVLKTHLVKQDLLYSQLLCPVAIAQETFAAANQLSGDKCEKSITDIPRSRYVER